MSVFKIKLKRTGLKELNYYTYNRGMDSFQAGDLIHVRETDEWYRIDNISFQGNRDFERIFLNIVTSLKDPSPKLDFLPDQFHYRRLEPASKSNML